MSIVQSIKETISRHCTELRIEKACLGYIYSLVQLENHATGVAFTFPRTGRCRHGLLDGRKPLSGRVAQELVPFLGAEDMAASSLALATVNAIISSEKLTDKIQPGDILDVLDVRAGDRVCMVGCFLPLIEPLKLRHAQVISFDESPKPGSHKPEELKHVLPKSQVAIITATSIINNTIDHLLELAQPCREVALLGPSTPLLATVFRGTPVTHLSGIQITAPELVQKIIAEGGGFRDFKQHVKKLNIEIREGT